MQHDIEDGQLKIIIEEDLVAASTPQTLDDIRTIISNIENITSVSIDIAKVEVMDSLGVNLLVGIYKQCNENQWAFEVTGSSPSILRLLSLYKLTSYFGIIG